MLELEVDFKSRTISVVVRSKPWKVSSVKIGELAKRAGVNASAIRYYEKLGLLPAPDRSGGQRRYPASSADRLLLIRFSSEMGFTLSEIRLFLSGFRDNASPS